MRNVVESLIDAVTSWRTEPTRQPPPATVTKSGPVHHRGVTTPDSTGRGASHAQAAVFEPAPDPSRELAYIRRRLQRDEAMPWPADRGPSSDLTSALLRVTGELSKTLCEALPGDVQRTIKRPQYPAFGLKDERHLGDVVTAAAERGLLDTLPISRDVLREVLAEQAFCLGYAVIFDDQVAASLRALDAIAPRGIEAALVRAYLGTRSADVGTNERHYDEEIPRKDRAVVRLESAYALDPERTLRAVEVSGAFDRLAGHHRFDSLVSGVAAPHAPFTHADLADLFARDELLQKAVSYFNGGASAFPRQLGRVGTQPLSEKVEVIPGYREIRAIEGKVREYFSIGHQGLTIERVAMQGGGVGSNWFTGLAPGSFMLGGRYLDAADLAKIDLEQLRETARALEAHLHPNRAADTLVLPTLSACTASPERVSAARRLVESWFDAPQTIYERPGTLFRHRVPLGQLCAELGVKYDDPAVTTLRAAMAERLEWTQHECAYGAGAIAIAEREALIVLFAESGLPLVARSPQRTSTASHSPNADLTRDAAVIETDAYLGKHNGANWTLEAFEMAWKASLHDFEQALRQPRAQRAVLVLGIPGAGKSTKIAECKRAGDVILDEAKLVFPERRAQAIAVAQAAGVAVEVVWVDTPLEVCIERNEKRPENRRPPLNILEEAADLLRDSPPTIKEGIARVYRVAGNGPAPMRARA